MSACSQGIQQAVNAGDQLQPLAGQGLLTLNVGLLLHFTGHQTFCLLTGAADQLLHLAIQLLHLTHLGGMELQCDCMFPARRGKFR